MKAQIYIVTDRVTSIYKDSSYYNPNIPLIYIVISIFDFFE